MEIRIWDEAAKKIISAAFYDHDDKLGGLGVGAAIVLADIAVEALCQKMIDDVVKTVMNQESTKDLIVSMAEDSSGNLHKEFEKAVKEAMDKKPKKDNEPS